MISIGLHFSESIKERGWVDGVARQGGFVFTYEAV